MEILPGGAQAKHRVFRAVNDAGIEQKVPVALLGGPGWLEHPQAGKGQQAVSHDLLLARGRLWDDLILNIGQPGIVLQWPGPTWMATRADRRPCSRGLPVDQIHPSILLVHDNRLLGQHRQRVSLYQLELQ